MVESKWRHEYFISLHRTSSDVGLQDDEEVNNAVKLSNPGLREIKLMVNHYAHHDSTVDWSQLKLKT